MTLATAEAVVGSPYVAITSLCPEYLFSLTTEKPLSPVSTLERYLILYLGIWVLLPKCSVNALEAHGNLRVQRRIEHLRSAVHCRIGLGGRSKLSLTALESFPRFPEFALKILDLVHSPSLSTPATSSKDLLSVPAKR